jgi:hypothetical protein
MYLIFDLVAIGEIKLGFAPCSWPEEAEGLISCHANAQSGWRS